MERRADAHLLHGQRASEVHQVPELGADEQGGVEGDAHLLDGALDLVQGHGWCQDAHRRQHVGAAGNARHLPERVLEDGHGGLAHDQGHQGGDVDLAHAAAAGARHLHGPPAFEAEGVLAGQGEHRVPHPQQLVDGLPLGLGGDGVGQELPPFGVPAQQGLEQGGALGAGEVLPGHELAQQKGFGIHGGRPPGCSSVFGIVSEARVAILRPPAIACLARPVWNLRRGRPWTFP